MGRPAKISDAQPQFEPLTDELYWKDSYSWALEQADALRRRDFNAVDWENVIEEIEDLARRDARRLTSHYARIMEHLLKLQYRHSSEIEPVRGWLRIVCNDRDEIELLFRRNPGLATHSDKLVAEASPTARKQAITTLADHATDRIHDVRLCFASTNA